MTGRPVLIACDGSARDRDAIALGRVLAGLIAAPLEAVAVHPCTPLAATVVGDRWAAMTRREADRALEAARAALGNAPGACCHRIAATSPALGLELAAEEADAAMIAVGATHRGPLGRALPGATGMQVVVHVPCPVAIAPPGYASRATRPARIGVAFDGSADAAAAVELASRLADAGATSLQVIGVLDPSAHHLEAARRQACERLERVAAEVPGTAVARLLEGRPARSLPGAAEALDLIVVGSHGRGALPRALLGSVSARLVRDAACPVVIVPGARLPLAGSRASRLAMSASRSTGS